MKGCEVMLKKENIGKNIKQERLNRGLSLQDVAYGIGCSSRSTILKYEETGISDIETISKICDFMNVNLEYILSMKKETNIPIVYSDQYAVPLSNKEWKQAMKNKKTIFAFGDENLLEKYLPIVENYNYRVLDLNDIQPSAIQGLQVGLIDMKRESSCPHEISVGYNAFSFFEDDLAIIDFCNEIFKDIGIDSQFLIKALILYLIKYRPKEDQNFKSVMKLLRAAEMNERIGDRYLKTKTPLDFLFDQVEKIDPSSLALKAYQGFQFSKDKKSAVIELYHTLFVFDSRELKTLEERPAITFDPETAYFIIKGKSCTDIVFQMIKYHIYKTIIQKKTVLLKDADAILGK